VSLFFLSDIVVIVVVVVVAVVVVGSRRTNRHYSSLSSCCHPRGNYRCSEGQAETDRHGGRADAGRGRKGQEVKSNMSGVGIKLQHKVTRFASDDVDSDSEPAP
jgi:hypothetical protein